MVGSPRDRKSLRPGLSNVGNSIARKTAAIPACSFKSDKLSSGQTAQSRLLEFSRRTSGLQLAAVDAIAKHLGHDFISAKKMDLKTMRLFLCARFCIDAANVCL